MRRRGWASVLLVAALGVAACDDLPGPIEDVLGTPSPGEDGGGAGDGTGDPTDGGTDGGENGGGEPEVAIDDGAGVGANGPAMLVASPASLVVEVDPQEGAPDVTGALDHLRSVLADVTEKADIEVRVDDPFASDRTSWSTGDLAAAADEHRDTASGPDGVSVHVLVVRGSFTADGGESSAIGVAYSASQAAVFPERWSGLGSLLGGSDAIARSVLVHEFGHLFGLVNLTYDSEIDHEDPEHPGHSANRASVMYYAVETTLIGQVFDGPPPDDFDEADRADLEGLRTGRY